MILADTSVWINHLRRGEAALADALRSEQVYLHPFVLAELACGNLRNRRELLELLGRLPLAIVATDVEALSFIEHRALMGRGIGYVDVHLLASTSLTRGSRLWTHDKRLAHVATYLGLAHS